MVFVYILILRNRLLLFAYTTNKWNSDHFIIPTLDLEVMQRFD